MKTLIKIDRKTIRKNPNAGNNVYQYSLGDTGGTVTITGKEGDLVSPTWVERTWDQMSGLLISFRELNPKEIDGNPGLKISMTKRTNIQTLYTLSPEPEWLYEYEDTQLTCLSCQKSFSHTKLEDYYDEDSSNNEICPCCGKWDCIDGEVRNEKIEDVIAELKVAAEFYTKLTTKEPKS